MDNNQNNQNQNNQQNWQSYPVQGQQGNQQNNPQQGQQNYDQNNPQQGQYYNQQYQQQNYYQNQQWQQYQQPYQQSFVNNHPARGTAVTAMVMGILSLFFCYIGYASILGLIFGVIGLIQGTNAKKAGYPGGMATAGVVMSVIGLCLSALVFVVILSAFSCVSCLACSFPFAI